MSTPTGVNVAAGERLYALLPGIYRVRDAAQGYPLRALCAVLESQGDALAQNLDDLYQSWFIETCPEWLVPYLGDLLGVRGLRPIGEGATQRPYVANTLGYRRRKGTVASLEQVAQDVTGWPVAAVEFFQRLSTAQHLNHVRPTNLATVDLRDTAALERLGGPFETATHRVDVRTAGSGRGRYNLPSVGLFLWRLEAFPVTGVPAAHPTADGPGRFRFSPLGNDTLLFNPRRTDRGIEDRTAESDVPGPLRRRPLYDELEAARAAIAAGTPPVLTAFSTRLASELEPDAIEPVFRVVPRNERAVLPEEIQICDLSDWTTLPPARTVVAGAPITLSDGVTQLAAGDPLTTRVAVDPALGRLAFLSGATPSVVHVDYFQGFSAALGGGGYDRTASLSALGARRLYPVSGGDDALVDALTAWAADGKPSALFEIADSLTYHSAPVDVPAGQTVELRSANGVRPQLFSSGGWDLTLQAEAELTLDGLLICGGELTVVTVGAAVDALTHRLTLRDCTLVPGRRLKANGDPTSPGSTAITWAATSQGALEVELARCITGRLELDPTGSAAATVTATDSILDATGGPKPALRAGDTTLQRCTLFGDAALRTLEASDVLFAGLVDVDRTQSGCVRFSYVPPGARVPRRYQCEPDRSLAAPKAIPARVLERVKPSFTSRRYGTAGYAQLSDSCADALTRGGSDDSELGAFAMLQQPHRRENLRAVLDEYLRFGLEAGTFNTPQESHEG